jgi:hypothetical protein
MTDKAQVYICPKCGEMCVTKLDAKGLPVYRHVCAGKG